MRRLVVRLALGLWLVGALVTWNAVFDNHVEAGARDYVDRQALFLKGQGPRADMDAMMSAAVASGARAATIYAVLAAAPGLLIVLFSRRRNLPKPQALSPKP